MSWIIEIKDYQIMLKLKHIQKWNGIRTPLTREFLEDFRTYLEQKITDQENNNYNYNYKKKNNNNQNHYYTMIIVLNGLRPKYYESIF